MDVVPRLRGTSGGGDAAAAAAALAGSWLLVIVAEVVLAELVPFRLVVVALALGNNIGQIVWRSRW